MSRRVAGGKWLVAGIACLICLMGCMLITSSVAPTSSPPHLLTPASSPPSPPTPSPPPDTGWQTLHPGLEQRVIRLLAADGRVREELSIFRIDPALYEFRIAYRPGEPQTLAQWQAETGALLVVNGGFFTEEFVATGLTVIEGQANGRTYGDFAGMFAVTEGGPEVRWLGVRPYNPNESLRYALQSFPMLLKPGGQMGYPDEDGAAARRTVVAQDGDGRVLFILAPWGSFTLHQLSVWLAESDLNLDVALNLDGGTSTGLHLAEPEVVIPAFTRLPIVITVFPGAGG
ncbi:MAG: phosphodiester glycosidase family protein [Anaerolineae bacterium]|nr:phosphodiester glycosidase family protein [Anaerolineae bacterium]